MKLFLVKRIDGLWAPHSDIDYEESKKVKPGDPVEVKLSNSRILGHHRKFFVALGLAYDNLPEQYDTIYPTKESFRKGLLLTAGHVEIVYHADGTRHVNAGSMSFLEMPQDVFNEVYSAVIDIILKYFLDDPDLQRQLIDLI